MKVAPRTVYAGTLAGLMGVASLATACTRGVEEQVSGPMREGSLECDDSRHYRFVVEGPKPVDVWAQDLGMPDTLRDFPGHPPQLTVRGVYDDAGRLIARAIIARTGYAELTSSGLPPSCRN